MSRYEDWVKNNHYEFQMQVEQCAQYLFVEEHMEKMGFLPDSPQRKWVEERFKPDLEVYREAYEAWKNPQMRTRLHTADLRREEKKMKRTFRDLYTGFMKSTPLVGDCDLMTMRMPSRFRGPRRRAQVCRTGPATRADTSMLRIVRLHFGNREGDRVVRRKPDGQAHAEIRWAVSDKPLASLSALMNVAYSTTTPYVFFFDDSERGKSLTYALRWINTRGKKGNFGPIEWTIIP
ncbi:MAG: hypothetical protein LBG30_04670 [Odoribacteraceae bacterium]|jgi:hypothetical protein|nr:hypothetical protein [Odoribacteraceae bacterium]